VSGAHFLKVPKSVCTWKAVANSQTLKLLGCFIHIIILNVNRSFLQTSFRHTVNTAVFRYRLPKNYGFAGLTSFQGFRETGPRPEFYIREIKQTTMMKAMGTSPKKGLTKQ